MEVFDDDTERRLLADDPSLTSLSLRSFEQQQSQQQQRDPHNYSRRIGRALSVATHLVKLELDLGVFRHDVPSPGNSLSASALTGAFDYIASCLFLESVALKSSFEEQSVYPGILMIASMIVFAINDRVRTGRNPLKSVSLEYMYIEADDLVLLLENGQLQKLDLDCCVLDRGSFPTEEQATRRVAQSFAACSTLNRLKLGVFIENLALVQAVLQEQEYSWNVNVLVLGTNACLEQPTSLLLLTEALATYIRNSPLPLQTLYLCDFFWTAESFAPIAETLVTASTSLVHDGGRMDDAASCLMLQSLYTTTSSSNGITATTSGALGTAKKQLVLSLIEFPSAKLHKALTDLIGSTRGLTDLRLHVAHHDPNRVICHDQFLAITKGLVSASCSIRQLSFATSLDDSQYETLIGALPHFRSVKYLEFDVVDETWKGKLLKAIRSNRSLREVCMVVRGGLAVLDYARLNACIDRNKNLRATIQSETSAIASSHPDQSSSTTGTGGTDKDTTSIAPSTTVVVSTTKGKLLPALLVSSLDPVVTAIGVSHLVGGLVGGGQSIGQHRTASGKRILHLEESG